MTLVPGGLPKCSRPINYVALIIMRLLEAVETSGLQQHPYNEKTLLSSLEAACTAPAHDTTVATLGDEQLNLYALLSNCYRADLCSLRHPTNRTLFKATFYKAIDSW